MCSVSRGSYGASNNAPARLKAPEFDEAKFKIDTVTVAQKIKLIFAKVHKQLKTGRR